MSAQRVLGFAPDDGRRLYEQPGSPGYGSAIYGQANYGQTNHARPNFGLADFIRLAAARRRLILRITLGTVLLAVLIAFILPTRYASSAVVMLDQRKNNVTDLSAVLSQLPSDPAGLQNQLQILTSRQLAATVIARLKLYNDPEFNSDLAIPTLGDLAEEMAALLNPGNWFGPDAAAADPALGHDRIVDAFLRHVSADAEGLSTAITVTATSRDPVKASRIANMIAEVYGNAQVATKVSATNGATSWLMTRIHDLAQQLQVQQEAVQRYKTLHNLTDTAPGNSLVDQQMVGISAQIVQARSDLAEKQAVYDRVHDLVQAGDAADITQVVSSPLIVQLRTQQADLIRGEGLLATTFGPLHPKMQEIEAQKRDLDQKIALEVDRIAGSIANELMVTKAHLQSLEGSLGGAEHQASGQNLARVQLETLQSNAASTRAMYEAFVSRLRQTQDQDEVQMPDSRVISPAPIPLYPSAPRRSLIIAASLPLGLLLGILAALLAEKLGPAMPVKVDGLRRGALLRPPPPPVAMNPAPPRALRPVAPPVPAAAPKILAEIANARSLRCADAPLDEPNSRFVRDIVRLVLQLEARPRENREGGAVIAITAAEPSESKSAIAVALARVAARMGKKVVLVDCDPARTASGVLHAPLAGGVYEVLTGTMPLNHALARDARGKAWLLGMPRRPPNAAAMFGSSKMRQLLATLSEGADIVILDCPVVLAGPEAALIARLAAATLLIVPREKMGAASLTNAASVLEKAQGAPIGVVMAA